MNKLKNNKKIGFFFVIAFSLFFASRSFAITCPEGKVEGVSTHTCIDATGVCGDYCTYTIDSTGKMTIFGSGEMYDYEYEGTAAIDSYGNPSPSYKYMYDLTSVVFAEGSSITRIGDYAFLDDDHLTDIKLPNTLLSIGESALGWTGLSSFTIPDSVEEVGDMLFEGFIPAEINCVGSEAKCYALRQMMVDNGSIQDSTSFNTVKPSVSCPEDKIAKGDSCIDASQGCGANYRLSDGICYRIRYTPAEAAEIAGESNTVFLYYK